MNEFACYICGRIGKRGFTYIVSGKWAGHHRCTNSNACALRIYRQMRGST